MISRIQLKSLVNTTADHRCAQMKEIHRDSRWSDANIDRFTRSQDIQRNIHRDGQFQLINTQWEGFPANKQFTRTDQNTRSRRKWIQTLPNGTIAE